MIQITIMVKEVGKRERTKKKQETKEKGGVKSDNK
jgi:hypothetical protein